MKADPEVEYQIRPIPTETARAIYKKHTVQQFDRRNHRKIDDTNQEAVSNELLDVCLIGWKGVVDRGQPVPCIAENKLILPTQIQAAIVDVAQQGRVTPEEKAASFREPAKAL
jgi:hypothetical protein